MVGKGEVAVAPSTGDFLPFDDLTDALDNKITFANFKLDAFASPTFTGTVTIPTPFTIGSVSMTATASFISNTMPEAIPR